LSSFKELYDYILTQLAIITTVPNSWHNHYILWQYCSILIPCDHSSCANNNAPVNLHTLLLVRQNNLSPMTLCMCPKWQHKVRSWLMRCDNWKCHWLVCLVCKLIYKRTQGYICWWVGRYMSSQLDMDTYWEVCKWFTVYCTWYRLT